ncbi:MAG: class I adenylate-forming enzyme family protein, partial [Pseudomonadota bacterium]
MKDCMPHALWANAIEAGGRPFLCTPDATLTYADLVRGVSRLSAFFDAEGLAQGDRVLIVTEQEQVAATVFIAAVLDGIVPVMLTAGSRAPRIEGIRASTEPRLVFCDPGRAEEPWAEGAVVLAENASPRRGGVLARVFRPRAQQQTEGGFSPFDGDAQSRAPRLPGAPDELAYLLFTSGTTGAPSGVEICRASLAAHLATLVRVFSYGAGTRIFNATPLAHTDGIVQGPLLALASGGTVLRPGPFALEQLDSWLNRVRSMGATHMISNPTILDLIDRHAPNDDYFDSPDFQGVVSSASILRPALWERFEQRFSTRLFNLYGMTETVANATYAGDLPEMGARGTIGRPIDCEARVDTASTGGDGESVGELQLRGDNIFRGYWKNPERTRDTLLPGGWMRTGDLARQRHDGSYELLGRIKTVINCGGVLLRPEEIDEVLMTHPAVAEVVTVGLPDQVFEEFPVSAVVPKDDAIDENA